ncbi:uncharacterized protein LOC103515958 isoform X1 [Diaphorina citri]|uniref:Uncharacterized protein LOC103515958 isoform X1 n=1 Tax=Diaphorina citri TaxID=121845 RepID=A0A1S3DCQ2_DIACI|nr:uncharacterized protein LOC103515958 isoform X1 [Diaphorina citri]
MNMNRRARNISNISIVKDLVKEKKKPIKKVLSKTKTSVENFQSFKRLSDDLDPTPECEKENVVVKRRKLQDKFDDECPYSLSSTIQSNTSQISKRKSNSNNSWFNSTLLSNISMNQFHQSRGKLVSNSKTKFTKSMTNLQTTLGSWKQKLRSSTRRRYQLTESPSPCTPSPITPKRILGRTPTKLYSPFNIETPPSSRYTHSLVMTPNTESDMIDGFNLCRITRLGIKQKIDQCLPY